jgi:hypothetical protein
MTENNNDWGDLEAHFVTQLREVKTEPVPPEIVHLAQQSYNGVPHPKDPEKTIHALHTTLPTEAKAAAFARHMKNAGAHTTPPSSVTVIVDPDRRKVQESDEDGNLVWTDEGKPVMVWGPAVNPRKVGFRAGPKRAGRPKA